MHTNDIKLYSRIIILNRRKLLFLRVLNHHCLATNHMYTYIFYISASLGFFGKSNMENCFALEDWQRSTSGTSDEFFAVHVALSRGQKAVHLYTPSVGVKYEKT